MFFTAVDPMFIDHYRDRDYDVTKPRIAEYKHNWKVHQNIVYWCKLRVAQSKGLQFYQTRSSFTTLYLWCASKRWWAGSQEKNCTAKRFNLPRYRKQSFLNRTCIMDGRTLQAPTRERLSTILASTEKLVAVERARKLVAVDLTSGSKDRHPQGSSPKVDSSFRDASKSRSVESRLEAKSRVQPIQRAVEGHDPQHGNMVCFEICEITSKVQWHNCMTYWTKGHVHCTCGTCLKPSDTTRKLNKDRFDVLSIPN